MPSKILQTNLYQSPAKILSAQEHPRLTEIGTSSDAATEYTIRDQDINFGSSPECRMAVPEDQYLSPVHARFFQDGLGRWMIEDQKSLNGVWLRARKTALDGPAEFQLGQQRFRFNPK